MGVIGLLALWALVLAACSDDGLGAAEESSDTDRSTATHAPEVTPIPEAVDEGLELPEDADPITFNYVELVVVGGDRADVRLGALVADTILRRTRGLMHRTSLPDNTGMIFAFPVETRSPFWNQDTHLDLEIAFLDAEGVILGLLELAANDPTLITPGVAYLFAVEMPSGWWAENGLGAGDQVLIPSGLEGLAE